MRVKVNRSHSICATTLHDGSMRWMATASWKRENASASSMIVSTISGYSLLRYTARSKNALTMIASLAKILNFAVQTFNYKWDSSRKKKNTLALSD
ncbi:MAG: hypothetical protein VB140_06520 [Burkholderia sp.]